jgi:hypothetical protein
MVGFQEIEKVKTGNMRNKMDIISKKLSNLIKNLINSSYL